MMVSSASALYALSIWLSPWNPASGPVAMMDFVRGAWRAGPRLTVPVRYAERK
jgi:hypothetical protein